MRWKTTLVLLAATVAVGAYIAVYEIKQPDPERRDEQAKVALRVADDQVTELTITTPQAVVTVRRGEHGWRLADGRRADESLIGRFLNQIARLQAERVLEMPSADQARLAELGLQPPVATVAITAGLERHTIAFGESTAVGRNRYAQVDDRPEVFVIPGRVFETIAVAPQDLEDPFFVRVTAWDAAQVEARSERARWVLARQDNAWRLTEPVSDSADDHEVTAWFERLGRMTVQRRLGDVPTEELARYGLEPAATVVELTGPVALQLAFGEAVPDAPGLRYARRSDEPYVYAVKIEEVESLLPEAATLRDRSVLRIFSGDVSRLEIQHGENHWAAVRQDGAWVLEDSGVPLDTEAVEDRLRTLSDLKIDAFADPEADAAALGLNPPSGRIAIASDTQPQPQELLVGAEAEGSCYVELRPRNVRASVSCDVIQVLKTTTDMVAPAAPAQSAVSQDRG